MNKQILNEKSNFTNYNLIQVNHPTSESLEFIPHSAWLGFHDIFQGPSSSFKLLALSQFPLFILMGVVM